jgi:hypothetical protein
MSKMSLTFKMLPKQGKKQALLHQKQSKLTEISEKKKGKSKMVCLWCTQDSSTVNGAKTYWLVMQKLKRIE